MMTTFLETIIIITTTTAALQADTAGRVGSISDLQRMISGISWIQVIITTGALPTETSA